MIQSAIQIDARKGTCVGLRAEAQGSDFRLADPFLACAHACMSGRPLSAGDVAGEVLHVDLEGGVDLNRTDGNAA